MRAKSVVRILTGLLLLGGSYGCDEESTGSGPDCRQEAQRCIDGLTCTERGDGWECLRLRDARVEDMGAAEDASPENEGGLPPMIMDGGEGPDATPVEDMTPPMEDMAPPMEDMAPPMEDMAPPMEDMAPPVEDMAPPVEDMAPLVEDMAPPVEDMAPPIEDMAPPVEDMAPPVEDMAPPVEDMAPPVEDMAPPVEDMAPPQMFGPGRCNHQRRIDEDDQYEPNPDQNSARQIQLGRHEGLVLRAGDSDWYRLEGLCENGFVDLSLDHPFEGGDLDVQVWADGGGRVIHSQGFCTGHEEGRYRIPADVEWINIGVYPFGPAGEPGGANTYTLELQMACP